MPVFCVFFHLNGDDKIMLTFVLSCVVNGTVFLPEYSRMITNIGSNSMVEIAVSPQSLIVLAQVRKHGEDDPIVPPN
ncbi:hypothetical protein PA905_03790 [Planktothrix agardhii CCAP 1459/11A]|jgi:hypothetical protein|nr:hypothetical protein PLAN_30642 [Planktothrix rubescens NIVA-CYA 18]CAD5909433.1 hypothetical protein NO2A_00068 [Planktothrix agardhii]CAD5963245.1 hypothetical protein NO108_03678 [Planktothrix rubescens]BBD56913.1 hypothetical protein NIES204_42480 [Planktothrix agardhii NIES-204]GDZ92683.1 hypothetical protein PA905_03790 [Planktothrix agardhii CCAP 1459/11A]